MMRNDLTPKYHRFATLREKLMTYTDRSGGPDVCWPWLGSIFSAQGQKSIDRGWNPTVYGRLRFKGEWLYTHRATFEEFVGPIPVGFTIDHTCFNGLCQNPAHLEAVSQSENASRYMLRKHWPERYASPRLRSNTRLPLSTIQEVRAQAAAGLSQRSVAGTFKINQSTVSRIVSRKGGYAYV